MENKFINNKQDYCPFDIKKVETAYNAKFVGVFCLKTKLNTWSEEPFSVFYVEKPENPQHSNYFGLIRRGDSAFITNAASVEESTIEAVKAHNGEIIYSAFRHDYAQSEDKSVFIDGGRDYVRASNNNLLQLIVKNGNLQLANDSSYT